jgi:uncharacterized membrane protein YfcA
LESEITIFLFLAIVAIGALIQTITGFAMGLIIMAGITLFGLTDIAFAAAVVSFISLLNAALALRSGYRFVDVHLVKRLLVGLLPAMVLGLLLLGYMSEHQNDLLKLILGLVVIIAGVSLMISPVPFKAVSRDSSFTACGAIGGLLAGLYSAGGAPLAYFFYRQPVSLEVIRFSLLAVFAVSTAVRALMLGVSGQLTTSILEVSLLSVPVVVVVTVTTSRFMHLIPDRIIRVTVFVVLMIVGAFLVANNLNLEGQFHP